MVKKSTCIVLKTSGTIIDLITTKIDGIEKCNKKSQKKYR